jgi:hypothetical protein
MPFNFYSFRNSNYIVVIQEDAVIKIQKSSKFVVSRKGRST